MEDMVFHHFFAFWYGGRGVRGGNFASGREQERGASIEGNGPSRRLGVRDRVESCCFL